LEVLHDGERLVKAMHELLPLLVIG
ncbi:MAG: hypothetical protein JWM13_407, partial [Arthrobacter sp.]|nr:hypothetical protein [Arthrobacter sp.]